MQNFNIINFNFWIIIKILAIIVLGIYVIFAFVIKKQVKVMTDTLTLGFESIAKFLSLVHLVFAITVFVTAIIVL